MDLRQLMTRPSATLATLCSEAMLLPTIVNSNAAFIAWMKAEKRHCTDLFIFDEAELSFAYDPASQRCLRTFLAVLLSSTQSRALLTSLDALGPLPNQQESLLPVSPLSPNDSLKLFFNLKPREIEFSEFGCMSGDSREAARLLSRHPVLVALEGVPRRIWRVEEMLGAGGMKMHEPRLMDAIRGMVEEEKEEERKRRARYRLPGGGRAPHMGDERALIHSIQRVDPNLQGRSSHPPSIPSPPAVSSTQFPSPLAAGLWFEVARHGSAVSYQALEGALQSHFVSFCRVKSRPLCADDLAVMRRKVDALSSPSGTTGRSGMVSVDVFIRFWPWFHALECTVARCRQEWMWTRTVQLRRHVQGSVYALHGFIEREQSDALLLSMNAASHPFLVRLSETRSGCLTVCWLLRGEVTYTLIRVEEGANGQTKFSIDLAGVGDQTDRQTFLTLSDLIRTYPAFGMLYPNIPKEEAFGRGPPHQDEAGEEGEEDDEEDEDGSDEEHEQHGGEDVDEEDEGERLEEDEDDEKEEKGRRF